MATTTTETIPASATIATGAVVGTRDKNVGWYAPAPKDVDPAVRDLLEKYSHVEPEQVLAHVLDARDKAWDIYPYPCIGELRFVDLSLSRAPAYPRVLSSLKAGASLIDLGCCVAQDLRKLVHDGAPATQLWGAELEAPYIDMGYDLFRDRETFKAHFLTADIFDESEASALKPLEGKMDIVHAGLFLHLFDWDQQVKVCVRIAQLLKQQKGVLCLGQQMATTSPGVIQNGKRTLFKHDDKTFIKMWKEVSEKTGIEWRCKAWLDQGLGISEGKRTWDDAGARRLIFEVERME